MRIHKLEKNELAIMAIAYFVACGLVGLTGCAQKPVAEARQPTAYFRLESGGALRRPDPNVYRTWVFVGEPLTPNDLNGGKAPFPEFHSVYIDPESYEHYRQTGDFREGTILIKELVSVGSKEAVSGNGYFMGDFIGLEATIKSAEHFPNEPGNWAYFSFTSPDGGPLKSVAAAFDAASCNGCHQASADDDWVFTQYYPVLRDAKNEEVASSGAAYFEIGSDGALARPVGYRRWVFVGEPVTPNDMNNGKAPFPEFHSVYIDPESYEHYRKTGEFRDGAILIKELVSVGSKQAVSGNGYFMGDFIGLEATIKSAERFPDEPGNWAYFSFTTEGGGPLKDSATPFATASCNGCHQASADDDWVFTQYYPALRAAAASEPGLVTSGDVDPTWQATAPTPESSPSEAPLDGDALFAFLQDGQYKTFPVHESNTHPGRGPHTTVGWPVKVFYNQVLAESFEAGASTHPVGSTAVKEMYDTEGALQGWAVVTKTSDQSNQGQGWFWYEATSTSDASSLQAIGNGVPGCVGCHAVGSTDFILSGYPL